MSLKIFVVIPNWNGADIIGACLDSLQSQSYRHQIVVVDNGSDDESVAIIETQYPSVYLIKLPKNIGFAGGVNAGIRYSLRQKADAIALFNNDAVADKNWLQEMVNVMQILPETGIVACKLMSADKKQLDSTGDYYTTWGLPYPRGRDETNVTKYDEDCVVFGASGGASLYRASMIKDIGLFDEDFFAYYEDVDLSFRAQLAGWKILYAPKAEAYHEHGSTSGKVKGFTTYQTFKNFPLLFWKNVPMRLFPGMFLRFNIAYVSIYVSSLLGGRGWPATKGFLRMLTLLPKKLVERHKIQISRKVSVDYINSILVHDLPPNADKLRKLRALFSTSKR